MLSYAQYSRSQRACSRGDAISDHQMTHRRRWSLPRGLLDLGRGRGTADGRRLLAHVRNPGHPQRIITRHGCGDAPRHCNLDDSRSRAAVPSMNWGGVPPTGAEDLPSPTYPGATVVTFTSGKGAVPASDGVSFHASATAPSRAVTEFSGVRRLTHTALPIFP